MMADIDITEAIINDDYLAIKQAIKKGLDLEQIIENELTENEESLLFFALHHKCSFDTIKLLIESGIDIEKTDTQGVSLLDEAIVTGDLELVRYLVDEKGMDVNQTKRKSGFTPLMQAASYGYTDIVDFLLEKGADIHARDSSNLNVIEYTKKLQRKNMQKHLENYLQK
jgi:ankyrin repeat protein